MLGEPLDAEGDEEYGWEPEGWVLPKLTAVKNLTAALVARGLGEQAASVVSRAAVRPDELRRKLAEPAELRVQGGTLTTVESRLWSMAVVPHPANPREYGKRIYPLGLGAGEGRGKLFAEPRSDTYDRPELVLSVRSPTELAQRLDDAGDYLAEVNPLSEDIEVEGVLQPITVVPARVEHANGHRPSMVLMAADGSSRVTAVHRLLSRRPSTLVYDLGDEQRKLRQAVSVVLRTAQAGNWDLLDAPVQKRLRALTVPARIVVGFRPDNRGAVRFHTAVRSFIGLTHIRAPLSYSPTVVSEAKADAVLERLAEPLRSRGPLIAEEEKRWFAATMSTREAAEAGFPADPDNRVAHVVQVILAGGTVATRSANSGIRTLTAKRSPTKNERVDIAVDLALRPLRDAGEAGRLVAVRAALQRAYRMADLSVRGLPTVLEGDAGSEVTLDSLRDTALREAGEDNDRSGRLGFAQLELAVKAVYYMATADPMALRREGHSDQREDGRSVDLVLKAMLSCERGIHQAYEIVRAGRAWRADGPRALPEVAEDGRLPGSPRPLTNVLVRETYTGQVPTRTEWGWQAADEHWTGVTAAVDQLRKSVEAMATVPAYDGGRPYVDRDGWSHEMIRTQRERLDDLSHQLRGWGKTYRERMAGEG
ncbi:hypothetical protein OH807_15865 [Kitasatospora sp. NBC_01560]|uniref:hypothetical protein n=1 Tax=Kitasatospora sp. NBC_01560 TaxID=2975965 RepID=UPI00386A284F